MAMRPETVAAGAVIIKKGDPGNEMYVIVRGEVEVVDGTGQVKATLREGDCFGEVALLLSEPRIATVRAKSACDLFVLEKADFSRILREHQQFAETIKQIARERYNKSVGAEQLMAPP
jgi:CRP-like cAMP-binding protein